MQPIFLLFGSKLQVFEVRNSIFFFHFFFFILSQKFSHKKRNFDRRHAFRTVHWVPCYKCLSLTQHGHELFESVPKRFCSQRDKHSFFSLPFSDRLTNTCSSARPPKNWFFRPSLPLHKKLIKQIIHSISIRRK